MNNYIVSARKYRPVKFSEVVGQSHVTDTLKNALKTNHLAQALLFCGPRGVGKTTCARILAKVVNCESPVEGFDGCNDAGQQNQMENVSSFSIFELDAASNNSVEGIRSLIEQVRFVPPKGKKKVYIIDEVHMLSTAAFNAFLKTLEEPPPYAIFILATTEKHKILPTILSRCQIYDFSRIGVDDIVEHLTEISKKENIEADADALHLVAQKADGALRDALSMFDRLLSAGQGKITYQSTLTNLNILDYDYYFSIVDAFLSENIAEVLNKYNEIQQKGFDGDLFINGLANHFRNLLVSKDEATIALLEVGKTIEQKYLEQAKITPPAFILNALHVCNTADVQYKMAKNKRLHIEMALIRLNYLNNQIELAEGNEATLKKKHEIGKIEAKVSPAGGGMKKGVDQSAELANTDKETPKKVDQPIGNETQNPIEEFSDTEKANENETKEFVNSEKKDESLGVSNPKETLQLENNQEENIITQINKVIEKEDATATNESKEEPKPSFKILNTQSNAVIIPTLIDLESKIELDESKNEAQKLIDAQEEKDKPEIVLQPKKVQESLTSYAALLKEQSKNVLSSLIGSVQFTIDGPLVQMLVDSKVKAQQLSGVKENLLVHLKKQLQQNEVRLKIGFIERTEATTTQTKAYSPKERLNEMMQENPDVKDLIEKLDLNFDY